jgi:hypothetical protein
LGMEAFGKIGRYERNVAAVYWRFIDCETVSLGPTSPATSANFTFLDQNPHTRSLIVSAVQDELDTVKR